MKEVKLPSGAVLKISTIPWADAKALYKAVVKELRGIELRADMDMANVYKDVFCAGFASSEVEARLEDCFKRCIYNAGNGDFKIDEKTFEPEKARQDYILVCIEVMKEVLGPFVKSLSAEFGTVFKTIVGSPA